MLSNYARWCFLFFLEFPPNNWGNNSQFDLREYFSFMGVVVVVVVVVAGGGGRGGGGSGGGGGGP